MGLSVIQAAASRPVSLADTKGHCRVDGTDEDALLERLIGMATERAEAITGRVLVTTQLRLTLETFPIDVIELPCPPLVSVEEISYLNEQGGRVALDQSAGDFDAITDELIGRVVPGWGKRWPVARRTPGSVHIDYTAGYGAAADVPESIRSWILLTVGTLYGQREAVAASGVAELPSALWDGLLDAYRVWRAA